MIFSLPPGSSNINIHLFTSELIQPPGQEDLLVQLEPLLGLNTSSSGIIINTSRPFLPHLIYHYFPAGSFESFVVNFKRRVAILETFDF